MSASSASPSRLAKMKSESATDADKDYSGAGGVRRNYSSDYTSKRLEELRIRRAESAAESYADYKARREARENKAPALSSDYADYSSSRTTRLTGDSTTSATATTTTTTTSSLSSYTSSSKDSSALTRDLTSSRDLSETSSKSSTLSSRNGLELQRRHTWRDEDDCIGFATLPDQVHRKAIKRGFDFTLMVVGEAGMGKSTLVSSLFLKDLYNDRQIRSVEEKVNRTVEIEKHYLEIEEKGVKLRLTIVDTPGFNDSLNGHESWKPITEYIEKQFDQYFKDESGLNRRNIKDNRVHCCLYFVSPLGHGLRQIDIQFMKRLHGLVNIVPVIAKADTLTPVELAKLKNRVLEEVEKHHIRIYEFPECDSDEDEEFQDMDKQLKASVPFAVIGSNHIADVNGKKVRARLYPWGIVEVDNNVHCDFGKLRQMLISTHMQDLKDITRDIHYENFRAKYIKEQMTKQQKERTKLKRDSMHGGDTEADKLLQQKDAELEKMRMMLSKMQEQLKGSGQVNGLGNL